MRRQSHQICALPLQFYMACKWFTPHFAPETPSKPLCQQVLGGVVIYFGVTISTWSGSVQEALDMNLRAGSLTILVTGVVIFLLAFLGCCGACKENSCMLSTVSTNHCCLSAVHYCADHCLSNLLWSTEEWFCSSLSSNALASSLPSNTDLRYENLLSVETGL